MSHNNMSDFICMYPLDNHLKQFQYAKQGMGLYIHIPFCVSKCDYCDFLSFGDDCEVHFLGTDSNVSDEGRSFGAGCTANDEINLKKQYVEALLAEMRYVREKFVQHGASRGAELPCINTVYIGGGTPTALPTPLLCEILQEARRFNLSNDTEITVEMNPLTNANAQLQDLQGHGVNRLSIGLQAWQGHLLAAIGRINTDECGIYHTAFTDTIQAAIVAGIDNINVDLMFGLPGQTHEHWKETLSQVIAHKPRHISAYSLTPAENTPLWDKLDADSLRLPDEATDREFYHYAIKQLAVAGYRHYELSNFAKPGKESRHNMDCWTRKPYLGFGLGAHSFSGDARWGNPTDLGHYMAAWRNLFPKRQKVECDYQQLSTKDAMAETMLLGLRLTDGVSLQEFYSKYGNHINDIYGSQLESLLSRGLLAYRGEYIALTPLGLDLANQVFEAFL